MSVDLRIGVVIQGPLLSRGRTGATAHIGLFQATQRDIVDYDCVPNIVDLFSNYRHEFDDFICVTWDTENTRELESKIGKKAIMTIVDNTPLQQAQGTIIPGNNKYRQFFSTLKGLERLNENGCTYAIKIRTDQSLDLVKLKVHLLGVLDKKYNTNRILVPGGYLQSPDHVEDFYFGARTDRLIDACKVFLEKPELFPSVHTDFFYKCSWLFNDRGYWPPNDSYTPSGKYSKAQYLVVKSAWLKIFGTFPREIYENLIWRGEKISKLSVDILFFDDMQGKDLDLLISSSIKIRFFASLFLKISKWFPISIKKLIKRLIGRLI